MTILFEPEPAVAVLHPVRSSRRRRVVGVDVWVEAPDGADAALDAVRAASLTTHLRLAAAVDEHGEPAAGPSAGALRMRFVGRDPEGHLTDPAIAELLLALGRTLRWSDVRKLEEFDGVPHYVPLPT
jgi:hypothetical protein